MADDDWAKLVEEQEKKILQKVFELFFLSLTAYDQHASSTSIFSDYVFYR